MKTLKTFFVFIFMCIVIVVYYLSSTHILEKRAALPVHVSHITITPTIMQSHSITKTLFVPYWAISKKNIDDSGYSQLVYFGITVDDKGIDTKEPGYAVIDNFLNATSSQKKHLLAVRMIDSSINTQVLRDTSLQHKIIMQS